MNVDLGLADLNIPVVGSQAALKSLVVRALELGYQTVALNTTVDQVQVAESLHPPLLQQQQERWLCHTFWLQFFVLF